MTENGLKLVLAGPMGTGKTTALGALSDTPPVSTEMPLADGPMGDKTTTTVALDFSTVFLDDGTPLQMYGLPGQEHFAYMRQIIMRGALGVLLLLSADDPEAAAHGRNWVASIREVDPDMPIVIGVTRADLAPDFRMDTIREAVLDGSAPIPIFTVDVREREQTQQLVRALLLSID